MSFFLDWMILIGMGFGIALICRLNYKEDSFLHFTLGILALIGVLLISVPLLLELNARDHGLIGQINESFFDFIKSIYSDYYQNYDKNYGGDPTSAEFMYSSGEPWLKDWFEQNGFKFDDFEDLCKSENRILLFFGILMFVTYPGWLILGIKLGFLLFGRKPGDKGALGFL